MRETQVWSIFHARYMIVESGGDVPLPDAEVAGSNDLIKPDDDGGAVIDTYTFSGPVEITVEILDGAPETVEVQEWELTDEKTLTSHRGPVMVAEIIGDLVFSPLMVKPGQRYHVRVSARGLREAEAVGSVDFDQPPVEFHLVQLWSETI